MSNVSIRGLSKRFGGKVPATAIDDLALEIHPGEFLVLLGPSGCGKTTTLRCIAGLESADEGTISVGERTVFNASGKVNVPPNKRNIGMVFQSYALWPHMTVRQNIGYPLKARRVKRTTASEWIEEVADLVDCGALLDRYPGQLSGGQQQRVALSRGLVARPDLVLFDEPLSNLDARLRDQVRSEIHELHQRLHFTAVYVTHDQSEALALGDRLAIMREGKVEQLGRPEEVFEEPATEYVAGFIGMGNRLTLKRRDDGAWHHYAEPAEGDLGFDDRPFHALTARARPEDLEVAPLGTPLPPQTLAFAATIVDSEFGGRSMDVGLTVGGTRLHSRMAAGVRGSWVRSLALGQSAVAFFRTSDLTFFDESGTRIPKPAAARERTPVAGV